ncbi:Stf0 family sulfotransferase [Cypionkella sinensis]|uniref:Stf0 family sulfotransferase n=1 Tax=Cypionkella sinensis TaxID=1756043 RepID=A0ABV7IV83_9RHOB
MNSYIICGTPRSGSTLLCGMLTAMQTMGAPDSFFMRDVDPIWAQAWGLPARGDLDDGAYGRAFLAAVIAAGRGPSDVFGLRLMWESLVDLQAMLAAVHPGLDSDRARLRAAFGEVVFVHLTRDDKLAQAVSLVRAEQTGLWHMAPDGTELERLSPPAAPQYDRARIAAILAALEQDDASWHSWFAAQDIQPLRLRYHDLAADPQAAVTRICAAVGVAAPALGSLQPEVAKLADAVNADWIARYRAEQA